MNYLKNKKELFSLLKVLLPENPVIIEAGAFDGKDTLLLHKTWPKSTIHAFEPVPEIYQKLKSNTQSYPNIICYPLALADTTGTKSFFIAEKPDKPGVATQAGSLLKPKERLKFSPIHYPKTIEVQTITLDQWILQGDPSRRPHGVRTPQGERGSYSVRGEAHISASRTVDFLWLDVQGMALPILEHAGTVLKDLKALWVEVEFVEAYQGQQQYEHVVNFLREQGFEIIAQDFQDTNTWFFGNILATKK